MPYARASRQSRNRSKLTKESLFIAFGFIAMAFASIYVPNFMLQAALCADPDLRGHPIALLDGTPPLFSVVAANDSAQQAGIKKGMTESQAAQFRGVRTIYRSHPCEESLHAKLLQIGRSVSPRIEDNALDTVIMDLSGLSCVFGSKTNVGQGLLRHATQLGLLAHIAIAANIETALHASRGFPGITFIPPGRESTVLGRLPVNVLLPSAEIQKTLECWGVSTCAELAALPVLQLSERLGQEGVRLHEFARGTSVRSLVLSESEMCFDEQIDLEDAVEELEPLSFVLGRLLDQLCARLRAHALAASAIRLRFTLGDVFQPPPLVRGAASIAKVAPAIYEKTLRLPVAMRDPKLLLNLLRLQLQADPPPASVLAISLAAESARPRTLQEDLFRRNSINVEKLELTLARLSHLVGSSNVGTPEIIDTHRPGTFRMAHFAFTENETKRRRNTALPGKADSQMSFGGTRRKPVLALRRFRPEWLAKIEVREGRPVHIRFRGMRGKIVAASGPWRTSGDWWREETWTHDEWDVQICFDSNTTLTDCDLRWETQEGLFRIYYDGLRENWFVSGRYD